MHEHYPFQVYVSCCILNSFPTSYPLKKKIIHNLILRAKIKKKTFLMDCNLPLEKNEIDDQFLVLYCKHSASLAATRVSCLM